MKLIVINSFVKVPFFKNVESPLDNVIHKGTEIEVGKEDTLDKLDANSREIVSILTYSGKVAQATPEIVAKVKAEIAAETAKEKKAEVATAAIKKT